MHIELIRNKEYVIINHDKLEIYLAVYFTTISDYGVIYIVVLNKSNDCIKLGYDEELENISIYSKEFINNPLITSFFDKGYKLI